MASQGDQFPPIIIDIPLTEAGESQSPLHSFSMKVPLSPAPKSSEQPMKMKPNHEVHESATHEHILCSQRAKESCYDSFRTCSANFDRQLSHPKNIDSHVVEIEPIPKAERYFDALEGPELENLKKSEKLILPEDEEWPFLLRFPISSFGMPLGVGIQALLWKTMRMSSSTSFLHVNPAVNFVLWCASLVLTVLVAFIYALKIIFYFEAVKREFMHPIRVNFFFAPWIGGILLALGVPTSVAANLHAAWWFVLMVPILCLDLKIYGQWMLGGDRRLSKVASPLTHLSIIGNFVVSLFAAYVDLRELSIIFFAIGLAHYIVLFVTLYQRLPTNETLPKELHPVFFLFLSGPGLACLSWTKISGSFDLGSRIAYFLALFLYASLAVRVNFFRGFRFSLVWWAYTVPMTSVATATIDYTTEVTNPFTKFLSVALSFISALAVAALLITTILHALVFHNLFPNDIAIAISVKRTSSRKKHSHRRAESTNRKMNSIVAPED
ncbi:hypothetical protein HPP92_008609 [Vanilla planifolia]|uniref:Uncharacterized protein n=1 Tax=Vanilla planifolia TaxID=51239 RepID=A0A835R8N9_VANPL|nr:hypothetical protein HPP92_008797 [Vanilla planifolia]KAG0486514.1 hypothetical protein HPP92_008609 [Vanilla planifolia]